MTKTVVDEFKPIQIQIQQCQFLIVPVAGDNGLPDPVTEQCPVGQFGQHIMLCQKVNTLFSMALLRDVAANAEHTQRFTIGITKRCF